MATVSLLDALDSIARLIATEEPKRSVDDGRFYLRFMALDTHHDGPHECWKIVKDRICTVFGPDVLNWDFLPQDRKRNSRGSSNSIFGHEDQEETKFYALVALLSLYIGAVHDNNQTLVGTLTTKLTPTGQSKIQMAFQFLLDNRRSMTRSMLESLISSSSPCHDSAFSTPYRPTSGSSSSLGESYIFSPTSSVATPPGPTRTDSPLLDFLQAKAKKELVEKLQRELRDTKTQLDVEKSEAAYLKAEVASLKEEKEMLKHDLDDTKGRLFSASNSKQSTVSASEFQELQQKCEHLQLKLSDVKDSDKYLKDMESQLEAAVCDKEDFEGKYKSTLARLNEKTASLSDLSNDMTSLQLRLGMTEEERDKLKETVEELNKQVQEMQAINTFRQSAIFHPGDPIGDISMDSPFSANVSLCQGETLGDAVVMNLQDEIARLSHEKDDLSKAHEEQSAEYQAQLSKIKVSLHEAIDQKTQLASQLEEKTKALQNAQNLAKRNEESIQLLTDQNGQVEADLAKSEQKNEELKQLLCSHEAETIELKDLLSSVESKYASCEAQLNEKLDVITNLESQLAESQMELGKVTSDSEQKSFSIENLKASISQLEKEQEQKLEQLKSELHISKQMCLNLETENCAFEAKLTSAQSLLNENAAQISSLQATISSSSSEVENLVSASRLKDERIDAAKCEVEQLKAKLQCHVAKEQTLLIELSEEKLRINEYESQICGLTEEKLKLNEQCGELQTQIKLLSFTVQDTESSIRELNLQVEHFEEELKTSTDNLKSSENQVQGLKQQLESITREKESLEARLAEFANLEADLTSLSQEAKQKIEQLQSELMKQCDKEQKLEEEVAKLKSGSEALSLEKSALEEKSQKAMDLLSEKDTRCAELESTLKKIEAKLQALEETSNFECELNEKLEEQLTKERQSYEDKVSSVQAKLDATICELDDLQSKYQTCQSSLEEKKAELAHREESLTAIQNELALTIKLKDESLEEVALLKAETRSNVEIGEKLEAELSSHKKAYESRIKDLEGQLQTERSASAKWEEMFMSAKKLLDEKSVLSTGLEKSLNDLKHQLGQLEEENSSLRSKFDSQSCTLVTLEATLATLQNELSVSKKLSDESLENLKIKEAQLEHERNNRAEIGEKLEAELRNHKKIHEAEVRGLEERVQAHIGESAKWENMYKSVQSVLDEKMANLASLEASLAPLKHQLMEREEETAKLRSKYDTQSSGMDNLVKTVELKDQTIHSLEAQLAVLKQSGTQEEFEEKLQSELKNQKQRYEAKIKDIHATLTSKYKVKVEECINKWQEDIAIKEKLKAEVKCLEECRESSKRFEDRYNLAKKKLEEVVMKMEELSSEAREKAKKQDSEIAKLTRTKSLLENKIRELEDRPSTDRLFQENQQYQLELKKLRAETRSLEAQNRFADAKIRELQKANSTSVLRSSTSSNDEQPDVFKMPSMKNTPGRTRATRTQSEVSMARRPPQGAGSIFLMDEEAGEMFSSSYLSDLKDGVCKVDQPGRISELARRNTMQPAHLKSSYPCETQFRPANEFTDDDLRNGKIQMLTEATANLSVDSPALNTRRQSSIRMSISSRREVKENRSPVRPKMVETPPQPSGLRPRKRPSMSSADVENFELNKRARKELSYSKPGPPTPARRHNRSNSSLNSSIKSTTSNQSVATTNTAFETPAKVHDKTPLLDSTNKSNRSLRSLKTPMSLKKVMTRAFRSKSKYSVKKTVDTPKQHS